MFYGKTEEKWTKMRAARAAHFLALMTLSLPLRHRCWGNATSFDSSIPLHTLYDRNQLKKWCNRFIQYTASRCRSAYKMTAGKINRERDVMHQILKIALTLLLFARVRCLFFKTEKRFHDVTSLAFWLCNLNLNCFGFKLSIWLSFSIWFKRTWNIY